MVFAIGDPRGAFPESVSQGIISGLQRSLPGIGGRPIEDLVQTDAAINPGNSGGPLIDCGGHVVGVNVMGAVESEALGFAVPASTVEQIVPELISHGEIKRATLGSVVALRPVDHGGQARPALVIERIGPAAPPQLQVGDILMSVGDQPVTTTGELFSALSRRLIGPAELTVLRGGQPVVLRVELRELEMP
jgi:S1-C subfamily serine protease